MFISTKVSESPRILKNSLNSNDEITNETFKSFTLPKITSTPKNNILATPPKSLVLTPRRYSLSEIATPLRSNRRGFFRYNSSSQNPPGPLLASTKYNINVSTFEDVKSPGLTSRIVEYNEETQKEKEQRPATHQTKYGSLGLFPVVHLFKKKLPLLEQKPRHVTVRVASPDYMKHTPEYNRRLLEGIVKPSSQGGPSNHLENSSSTRSVLDALKEISRKRIHANVEVEIHEESGKRIRTESEDCTDSNKRLRDESPILETTSTSPTRPALKKICMYDEYAASRSSMDYLIKSANVVPKRKSISISTITEDDKESKQIKFINAETQTLPDEESKKEQPKDDINEEGKSDKPEQVETILKVFDDAPLERIRKNRLAALMGTLVGKSPILEPKPDYSSLLQDENDKPDKMDKPLVSILTQSNKSPTKLDKHVHFNIPESNSNSTTEISENSESTEHISIPSTLVTTTLLFDTTTSNITVPTASNISVPTTSNISVPTTSNISVTTTSNISIPTTSNISAPTTSNSTANISLLFPNKPAIESTANFPIVTSKPPILNPISSPPKVGGFKFDLTKPICTPSTPITKPALSFGTSSPASVPTFGSLTNTNSTFNKPETKSDKSSPYANKISIPTKTTAKPSFSFGVIPTAPSSTAFNFGGAKPTSTTASSGSIQLFGVNSSTNGGYSTVTTSAKTSFSTITSVSNKGLITSPSVTSNFGSTSAFGTGLTSTVNVPTFGNMNTSIVPTFGNVNTTSAFGSPIATNNSSSTNEGFGATPGFAATPGFGAVTKNPVNSDFSTSTNSVGNFGISTTSFGAPTTFGTFATSASNLFGTTTTSTSKALPSPFSSQSVNNEFITPTSTPSLFGNVTANNFALPINSSTFGTTTTTTAFGFGNPNTTNRASTTTANTTFGTTGTGFGTNSGSLFNNTNIPSFGGSTTPSFGSTSSGSSFTDAPFGAPTTTNSLFGLAPTTTVSFTNDANNKMFGGTAGTFGTNSAASSMFGPSQNQFGTGVTSTAVPALAPATAIPFAFAAKTIANSTFGTTSTTNASFGGFEQNTSFGNQQSSNFGNVNKAPIFGNSNAPSFGGTTAATPGFGNASQQQQFATTGSMFNKPQSPVQTAFGSTQFFNQQQQQQQNNTNNFASTNQQAVFTFGSGGAEKSGGFNFSNASSGEAPKKFDFTGANTAPPAFGAPFGSTAAPNFGAAVPVPVAGGFSIGAGPPTSGRPRPMIKGKRRT